ncbi:MAG: hypothetical protein K8I02_12875 [Candidatus Methylomirabilis sp.]|nr:hypothetical protein [Deltaproteobacteria bacterium]
MSHPRVLDLGLLCAAVLFPGVGRAHEGEPHGKGGHGGAAEATRQETHHAHKAAHGGVVNTVGDRHVELVVEERAIAIYLLDGEEKPLPIAGRKASAVLLAADEGKQTLDLKPTNDHFRAATAFDAERGFVAVVTIEGGGETITTRFRWPSD